VIFVLGRRKKTMILLFLQTVPFSMKTKHARGETCALWLCLDQLYLCELSKCFKLCTNSGFQVAVALKISCYSTTSTSPNKDFQENCFSDPFLYAFHIFILFSPFTVIAVSAPLFVLDVPLLLFYAKSHLSPSFFYSPTFSYLHLSPFFLFTFIYTFSFILLPLF
jgi:hypothetical protein